MAADLIVDHILSLNKTNASKILQAAVRKSQNTTRASYKPHACPTWWVEGKTVTLSNGNTVTASKFGNPKDLSLVEIQTALHLYCQSQVSAEDDHTTDGNGGVESSSETPQPETKPQIPHNAEEAPIPTREKRVEQAQPPSPPKRRGAPRRGHRRKREFLLAGSDSEFDKQETPVRTTRARKAAPRNNEEQQAEVDTKVESSATLGATDDMTSSVIVISEDEDEDVDDSATLVAKRTAYIQEMRKRKDKIASVTEGMRVAKIAQLKRMIAEVYENLCTTQGKIEVTYEQNLIHWPHALLHTTMREIVEKYGMNKEKWLHSNVALAVERALKDNKSFDKARGNTMSGGVDLLNDMQSPRLLPVTPPARTPAARKRRKDVQDTIRKTMRRVRMEVDEGTSGKTRGAAQAERIQDKSATGNLRRRHAEGREAGDVLAALGIFDETNDPDDLKNALTRTMQRKSNPDDMIGIVEEWLRETKRQRRV